MGYRLADMMDGAHDPLETASSAPEQLINAAHREIDDGDGQPTATDSHRGQRFAQMVEAGEDIGSTTRTCVCASHRAVLTGMATIERRA